MYVFGINGARDHSKERALTYEHVVSEAHTVPFEQQQKQQNNNNNIS